VTHTHKIHSDTHTHTHTHTATATHIHTDSHMTQQKYLSSLRSASCFSCRFSYCNCCIWTLCSSISMRVYVVVFWCCVVVGEGSARYRCAASSFAASCNFCWYLLTAALFFCCAVRGCRSMHISASHMDSLRWNALPDFCKSICKAEKCFSEA